ncbi:unnamed protein product, partial [Meganyctiphanes norvegica]
DYKVDHEIGHAMGFYHEQSRSDRADYIILKWDNINEGELGVKFTNNDVKYDYSSRMHGHGLKNTKNGKLTILTKDSLDQELIGSNVGLSHRDWLTANKIYKCIDKWLSNCNLSEDPCQN